MRKQGKARVLSVVEHESRHNVHCHELETLISASMTHAPAAAAYLLKEEFSGVRNRELRHLFGAFAVRAPPVVAQQATFLARIHLELVRRDHEPFEQQLGGAVANETVTLHLTQSETTFSGASFRGLTGQRCAGSPTQIVNG
jgi:hypothetical protein